MAAAVTTACLRIPFLFALFNVLTMRHHLVLPAPSHAEMAEGDNGSFKFHTKRSLTIARQLVARAQKVRCALCCGCPHGAGTKHNGGVGKTPAKRQNHENHRKRGFGLVWILCAAQIDQMANQSVLSLLRHHQRTTTDLSPTHAQSS